MTSLSTAAASAVRSSMKKATIRIVPFILLMYIMAFVDRVNLGFATNELKVHAGVSTAAYALGASLFFVTYCFLEVPSNVIMHKVGARIWMARIMISWGLISAATMFVNNEAWFYVLRLLLGAAEAGFFPGIILFLTYWFPDEYRGRVTGLFYFGAPLAFIFGAPVSGMFLNMDGVAGLWGYPWMFLMEGLGATAVGIAALFVLCDAPRKAKWLTEPEKKALTAVLDAENAAKNQHGHTSMLSAMKDRTVLYFGLVFALVQMGVSVALFFLPAQISAMMGKGANPVVTGFVVAIPWTCALLATYFVPRYAEKVRRYGIIGGASLILAAVGMLVSAGTTPVVAVVALCLAVAGLWACQPIFWTLLTNYKTGAAAVTGIALVNTIANIGNFFAPNVKVWADQSFNSGFGGLIVLALVTALAGLIYIPLGKHKGVRATAGEAPVVVPNQDDVASHGASQDA
ncbi:MFS transporter [Sinomonas notoginsengisoli]|uniref:MFS transporter n=1 Tax=Sinomonas notoginsengisoli TaxID=1457311 RepID=UPI001F1A700B|nr:MFS transporter [Sinomonas notoginsengisoli]